MKALLIVDLQRDFCPGGALAVAGGDAIVPYVNSLVKAFRDNGELIIATKDWHPSDTAHFAKNGGPWPVHCEAFTDGARFHADLDVVGVKKVFLKGQTKEDKGYSAFEADGVDLPAYLKCFNVDELVVVGLATDYCVKATVLDALKNGFKVTVDTKGIAAVNIKPTDGADALAAMTAAGAVLK